jgi:hypothetical protein
VKVPGSLLRDKWLDGKYTLTIEASQLAFQYSTNTAAYHQMILAAWLMLYYTQLQAIL